MKKIAVLALAIALLTLSSFGQSTPRKLSQHATVKVAKFSLSALKKSAGAVLFAVEPPIDALHLGFHGAAMATNCSDPNAVEKAFQVVHYLFAGGDVIFGKADAYDEKAEQYFFGSSN